MKTVIILQSIILATLIFVLLELRNIRKKVGFNSFITNLAGMLVSSFAINKIFKHKSEPKLTGSSEPLPPQNLQS